MAADYSRIHRLLKILRLIQGEPGWGPKRLAAECNTHVRSIYRDMQILHAAGIPWFYDPESKGYIVRRDFFLPAVSLTPEESVALVALAEHIGGKEQIPMMEATAIAKVRCNLPAKVQQELAETDPTVQMKLAAAGSSDGISGVYHTVQDAIRRRKVLVCEYAAASHVADGDGYRKPFLFSPYILFFSQRAWYAVGYHQGRRAVRCASALGLLLFATVHTTGWLVLRRWHASAQ